MNSVSGKSTSTPTFHCADIDLSENVDPLFIYFITVHSAMMTNMLLLLSLIGSVISASVEFLRNSTQASYYLTENFAGTTFFDNFHFDTYDDPTHGE